MFKTLREAFKVKEIRSKMLFTLMLLVIYRLGTQITVPGINASALSSVANTGLVSFLDTVTGGGLASYSIFSMGVSPFITAQIVVQLLQMDIVPKFVEWSKQGEVGRRKLNQVTRYLTIVLGLVQAIGITAGFNQLSGLGLVKSPNVSAYVSISIILTGGTMLLTWIGEQITDKGLGNGVSVIIFAGIISRLPNQIQGLYQTYIGQANQSDLAKNIGWMILLVIVILLVIQFVTYVQQASRRIPIQYTRRAAGSGSESFLPLKVNVAGVIPVIFASSFIVTPQTILMAFQNSHGTETWYKVLAEIFSLTTYTGIAIYTLLIVLFTFFYAFVQVNPEKLSENLQKQGAYIPGIWPGNETISFMNGVLMRLSTVGSVFLGIVALIPLLATKLFSLPQSIGLGGTSLLIVVGVTLEMDRQLKGLLKKREYVGFIR
ncbi:MULTISPECIES: preprotein translocase subunit SecY [Lactobacillaceae]|uniref:preprotein translocase subunit SecY n=1 Tax=Lactobacillaceae TaxID=33958 RepID=UPI000C1B6C47|nr:MULTISPECIES: preprotein translocase subunit SecY [Lactobacillaceae]